MGTFTRIVVAVDFSETSRDVLHYALQLADASPGSTLDVLHVVPDPLQQPWTLEAASIDFVMLEKSWVADAQRRLGELIAAEGSAASSVKPIVLVGRAAEAIVQHATELTADVIVMGTHGHRPITRFILGSVVERVLRQATCAVLTVPHRSLQALANGTE